mmetsp:Transcript_480/g.595  ORF Transcript_480/g.595 Transcript_480/m.595 type:complete len:237 (-) Transcript_480:68-778(-)
MTLVHVGMEEEAPDTVPMILAVGEARVGKPGDQMVGMTLETVTIDVVMAGVVTMPTGVQHTLQHVLLDKTAPLKQLPLSLRLLAMILQLRGNLSVNPKNLVLIHLGQLSPEMSERFKRNCKSWPKKTKSLKRFLRKEGVEEVREEDKGPTILVGTNGRKTRNHQILHGMVQSSGTMSFPIKMLSLVTLTKKLTPSQVIKNLQKKPPSKLRSLLKNQKRGLQSPLLLLTPSLGRKHQ